MTASSVFHPFPLVKEEDTFLAFNKEESSFSSESSNFVNAEMLHEKKVIKNVISYLTLKQSQRLLDLEGATDWWFSNSVLRTPRISFRGPNKCLFHI